MKTMMMITIAVLMTMTMAKSDEPINVKVKNYIVNEVNDIKEYQKQGWEDGKIQLANDKETVTNFFDKVVTYVTQSK